MKALDGMNEEQTAVLFKMIARVIRSKCRCHIVTGEYAKCSRCRLVEPIREAFPETWRWAADIVALVGEIK